MKYKGLNRYAHFIISGAGSKGTEFMDRGMDQYFETLDINHIFRYVASLNEYKFSNGTGYSDGPFQVVEASL